MKRRTHESNLEEYGSNRVDDSGNVVAVRAQPEAKPYGLNQDGSKCKKDSDCTIAIPFFDESVKLNSISRAR